MKRRIAGFVLLALVLSLNASAGAANVTIKISHWLGGEAHGTDTGIGLLIETVRQEVAKYGIDVEVTISGGDYNSQVITQTLGGVGPDVIFALPYSNMAIQEFLIDLTPYLSRDPELNFDSYNPVVWDIFTYDGATKLLPVGVAPYLLFYNADHFRESGMPFPDETWSWHEEIPDALRRMRRTDGQGNVTRYGLLLEDRLWTLYFSEGGDVLSEDGSRSLLAEAVSAGQFLETVYQWRQDNLIPAPANHRPTFASGLGSMHGVMGTFAFPFYVEQATQFDWSFTLPPLGSAGRSIDENVNGWGISSFSPHPDEAWIVLKALAQVSGALTMNALGHFSPIKGKIDADTIEYLQSAMGLTPAEIQTALDAINYVRPRFRHQEAADITRIVEAALRSIAWQGRPSGPALESAAEQIDAILAGGGTG